MFIYICIKIKQPQRGHEAEGDVGWKLGEVGGRKCGWIGSVHCIIYETSFFQRIKHIFKKNSSAKIFEKICI